MDQASPESSEGWCEVIPAPSALLKRLDSLTAQHQAIDSETAPSAGGYLAAERLDALTAQNQAIGSETALSAGEYLAARVRAMRAGNTHNPLNIDIEQRC